MPPYEYGCETCHDVGFVRRIVDLTDPSFGKAEACPRCRPDAMPFGLPEGLKDCTFENFDIRLNPGMASARSQVQQVSDDGFPAWCAVLAGKPGLGKSHLAAAALNQAGGSFWETGALLRNIRHLAFDERGPKYPEGALLKVWQEYKPILVLDDMGAEKLTEWANQTLYAILNARYQARLPTIITSNIPDSIDDRLLSRFSEGLVPCQGADIRRQKGA